jgi:N-acetylglutamate synthase-like GNAT family acetyltransferase
MSAPRTPVEPSREITVLPLRDCRQAIEQLAEWQFSEWGKWNPANNVERRIARLREHTESQGVPQTWVAWERGELLGSASLVTVDLESHGHLSPWLASVYVHAPYRNRGAGSALVRRVGWEAGQMGLPRIYLFTPDRAPFYARLGWETIEQAQWGATPVTIMQLDLRQ